ncbi:MAG: sensor histidine kinase [Campylobacterales bacterium]
MIDRFRVVGVFLLFCFFSLSLNASLVMDKNYYKFSNFQINYLIDQSGDISEISKKSFNKTSSSDFSFGYVGKVWLKIEITNKTDGNQFVLTLNESFYDKANLYIKENNTWIEKKNGIDIPLKSRHVKHSRISFDIDIPKDSSKSVFIELKTKYPYFGNVEVYQKDFFPLSMMYDPAIVYIFVLGISLVILFFTFLMYMEIKERVFLYYSGYLFFNIIYLINMSGILVYVDLAHYIYALHFATCFFIAFLWLFTLEYLEIKKDFKKLSRFFLFVSYLFFALGLYTLFDYQALLVNGFAFAAISSMLLISLYLYVKKIIRAKYFSYVIVIYLVSGFIYLAMLSGLLEYNYFTRNSVLFATGIANILFMLILTRRYKKLKDEYKQELEKTVSQRTKELQVANKDKELLLKEIQHRVKNNFHLILALLWMKSKTNTEITPIIRRIESMALIHDYLYNSNNLDEFDMEKYLREITNSFIINDRIEIQISYNLDFNIQNTNATNLAMIVNEIITNSIKHNQIDNIKVDIEVKNEKNRVIFIIQDNGKGIDSSWKNGLGLDMVDDFCSKLQDSNYSIINNNGVRFELQYLEDRC